MALSPKEEMILHFMEEDLEWVNITTKEQLVAFWKLAKELEIEDAPEYAADLDEVTFEKIKDIIFIMGDGILDEQTDLIEATNDMVSGLQDETEDDPEEAYYAEVAATIDDSNEETEEVVVENYNDYVATEVAEREEDNMNKNTNGAMNNEEMTMGQKARAFAESAQDKVQDAAAYIMDNVPNVKETVKDIASMGTDELEDWLKDGASNLFETIKEKLQMSNKKLRKVKGIIPGVEEDIKKSENILNLFSEILDDEEKNGWGKFKAIVSALVQWLVRIIIRAAQIALKVAIVVAVGAVKIGAVMIDTGISAAAILHQEVIKPAYKSAKSAYAAHKERKANQKEFEEDFEEYLDEE